MNILAFILIGLMILCIIGIIRTQLVYSIRTKALNIVRQESRASIRKGDGNQKNSYAEYYAYGSFDAMMLKLTKWRFKDFYPGIERSTDDLPSQPIQ